MEKFYFKNGIPIILLFLTFSLFNFDNKANAQVDHTGIIWVVPKRADAFPLNGNRTGNAGLNLAFEDYHVIEYVFLDSLYICDLLYKQPIYQIKLHGNFANLEEDFIYLLHDCYPGFFQNVALPYDAWFIGDQEDPSYNNGMIYLEFYDHYFNPTLLPSSNIRSYNKHMNLILREYDILSYTYDQWIFHEDTVWRIIEIKAKYQDILPLYYDLLSISYLYDKISITCFYTFFDNRNPCGQYSAVYDEEGSLLKIYPNPANDEIFISGVIPELVILYDVMGKMVVTEFDTETNKINIKDLTNGLYILKIISNDGKIYTEKIFKQ